MAQSAAFADHRMRMSEEVVANRDVRIDHDMRKDGGMITNGRSSSDDHIGPDMRAGADPGRGIDHSRRMDARRVVRLAVEKADGPRKCKVGVIEAQRGGGNCGKVGSNQQGRRGSRAGCCCVLGIRDKRQLPRAGFFDPGNSANFHFAWLSQR